MTSAEIQFIALATKRVSDSNDQVKICDILMKIYDVGFTAGKIQGVKEIESLKKVERTQ